MNFHVAENTLLYTLVFDEQITMSGKLHSVSTFIGITVSGCCSNVYTFEKLIKSNSQITTLITFSQYLFIFVIISIYLKYTGYWKKNPQSFYKTINFQYLLPVISQNLTAILNNYVFQYDLPMPTHIILRSLGSAITLLLDWIIWGKRYSFNKILGSELVGIGAILFTIDVKTTSDESASRRDTFVGILILLGATIINSITSLYKERIYQDHSNEIDWKKVLYYNYFYGLLFFIPLTNTILQEYERTNPDFETFRLFGFNWITQLCCILGVNILSFKVTALSLTIILLLRRFLSLFLSIYIFETPISLKGYIGAIFVILGTITYLFGKNMFEDKRKFD